MVNHYEYHHQISNKLNLFTNLVRYCEKKQLDIWKYIPFTVIINFESQLINQQYNNFTEFFNNIGSYINKSPNTEDTYATMFCFYFLKDKLGYKTPLYIPSNHYSGYNMWVIKAIDLNRGRCIKIAKDISKITNLLKQYKKGVERGIKEEESTETSDLSKSLNGKMYKANNVIIQKYIESPLLYKGRKFDIRIWVLITHKMEIYAFRYILLN
jgi:tubulin--tyrosine ligase